MLRFKLTDDKVMDLMILHIPKGADLFDSKTAFLMTGKTYFRRYRTLQPNVEYVIRLIVDKNGRTYHFTSHPWGMGGHYIKIRYDSDEKRDMIRKQIKPLIKQWVEAVHGK